MIIMIIDDDDDDDDGDDDDFHLKVRHCYFAMLYFSVLWMVIQLGN